MRPKHHLEAEYKSGLEARFQEKTRALGYELPYEEKRIKYTIPEKQHTYTPDFEVTSNVYIETKGLWTGSERKKACLLKAQHPHIKILYVLYRDQRLSKKSTTTYITWAQKQGLLVCTFKDSATWIKFIEDHLGAPSSRPQPASAEGPSKCPPTRLPSSVPPSKELQEPIT